MIPVKWYIAMMLFAGVATFFYCLVNLDVKGVLGSFLFFGLGGGAYFIYKKAGRI